MSVLTDKLKMTKRQSNIIETLKLFRDISLDQTAHKNILKEKKIVLYAATLLENDNVKILELCLDILENFANNESSHAFLLSTFGIYEALEALSIRMRSKNESLHRRATEITELLRSSAPPAYNTRSRLKGNMPLKRHHLFLLFIADLNNENQVKVEHAFLKIRGIISFLLDMELKRCTIRICPRVTIKEVIEKLYNKCSLKAVVITKNIQEGIETYHDVLDKSQDRSYLEYPEEEYSIKGKLMRTSAINWAANSNSLLKSVVNFWNESFYW